MIGGGQRCLGNLQDKGEPLKFNFRWLNSSLCLLFSKIWDNHLQSTKVCMFHDWVTHSQSLYSSDLLLAHIPSQSFNTWLRISSCSHTCKQSGMRAKKMSTVSDYTRGKKIHLVQNVKTTIYFHTFVYYNFEFELQLIHTVWQKVWTWKPSMNPR